LENNNGIPRHQRHIARYEDVRSPKHPEHIALHLAS